MQHSRGHGARQCNELKCTACNWARAQHTHGAAPAPFPRLQFAECGERPHAASLRHSMYSHGGSVVYPTEAITSLSRSPMIHPGEQMSRTRNPVLREERKCIRASPLRAYFCSYFAMVSSKSMSDRCSWIPKLLYMSGVECPPSTLKTIPLTRSSLQLFAWQESYITEVRTASVTQVRLGYLQNWSASMEEQETVCDAAMSRSKNKHKLDYGTY